MTTKSYLIFTDLDGTLIDHKNYSFGTNGKLIKKLIKNKHQVIINSSKTYIEIKKLIKKLNLEDMPFSSENGAFIFFPKKIFSKTSESLSHEKYWKIQLAKLSSKEWYQFLKYQQKNFQFEIIADLPSSTIKKITNLKNVSGMLDRMASQLIIWKDSKTKFKNFQKTLKKQMNGTINEGGRFMQISSPCNKRIASRIIIHKYKLLFNDKLERKIIALGDSRNDKSMLNFSNYPCVIKNSHAIAPKIISTKKNIYKSTKKSPQGWKEAINYLNQVLPRKIFQ